MANLTLVIDDDVLKRARIRALEDGTSVNAVVRDQLARYAAPGRSLRDVGRQLVTLSEAATGSSGPGGRGWTRDELYDR